MSANLLSSAGLSNRLFVGRITINVKGRTSVVVPFGFHRGQTILAFLWNTGCMARRKKRIPKKGDRVTVLGWNGTFVVSSVDSTIRNVLVTMIGHDFALDAIPWDALTYLDELDSSQNALRIVREATGKK
jgi:hypothetical protein